MADQVIPDAWANRQKSNYQEGNPYWFSGTHEDNAKTFAYDEFYKLTGRAPTETEISQFVPIYLAGDPNTGNVAGGNAAVAQYVQNKNITNPTEATKNYDSVNQAFQSVLGRDASDSEKQHFGGLVANQSLDQYSLTDWLKQLPEAVQKQDAAFRTGLTSDLQKQDAQYYNEQVMPGIASNFAKQGRSFDSSGYAQALAQAAQQQNRQRESFLSNLSASQYGGSQANARQDYMSSMANNYGATQQLQGSANDYNMYNLQKNAYDQYLQRYGKRSQSQAYGSLAGGLVGAGIGAYAGGPQGAMVGYQFGSGIGGGFGGNY